MPRTLRAFVPQVPQVPYAVHAFVPRVLRGLRAIEPYVLRALRALVSHMPCALRVLVPPVLSCLTCSSCIVPCVLPESISYIIFRNFRYFITSVVLFICVCVVMETMSLPVINTIMILCQVMHLGTLHKYHAHLASARFEHF